MGNKGKLIKQCCIFAGADFSLTVTPPENALIVAADSGYSIVKRLGLTADIAVGDFDSLDEVPKDCEVIRAAPEKDDTDTMLAVKTALSRGFSDITVYGAVGGRLDHTYANIQTLAYILKNGGFGRLVGECDTVELLPVGSYSYKRRSCEYLSLFSYGENAVLTTSGTKYNLTDYRLENTFPLGVSNEIIEDKCRIFVQSGQILVIFPKK